MCHARTILRFVTKPADVIILVNRSPTISSITVTTNTYLQKQPWPLLPLLANSESTFGSMLGVPSALELVPDTHTGECSLFITLILCLVFPRYGVHLKACELARLGFTASYLI